MNHREGPRAAGGETQSRQRKSDKREERAFQSLRSAVCLSLCLCVSVVSPCLSAEPLQLTKDGSFKQHLQWSPDGKTLLFTRIHQGKMGLWTMPADGGEMKRLLPNHTEPHFDGHFSNDGKRIVYVYDKLEGTDGKLRINVCAADGSDDQILVPHKA